MTLLAQMTLVCCQATEQIHRRRAVPLLQHSIQVLALLRLAALMRSTCQVHIPAQALCAS